MDQLENLEIRKRRNAGDVLTLTFDFIRQNFRMLAKSTFYLAAPFILIGIAMIATSFGRIFADYMADPSSIGAYVGLIFMSGPFLLIGAAVEIAAVNQCVILYLEKGPGGFDFAELRRRILKDFPRTIGMMTLMILIYIPIAIIAGFIPFLGQLAVIYLEISLAFVFIIRSQEGVGVGRAFSRSFEVIRGRWWRTFGLALLTYIVVYVLGSSIIGPFAVGAIIYQMMIGNYQLSPYMMIGTIATFGAIGLVLGFPLLVITILAINFQYYNLVEEKEGLGLIEKIETIGSESIIGDAVGEAF